jgi:hypothetical protein
VLGLAYSTPKNRNVTETHHSGARRSSTSIVAQITYLVFEFAGIEKPVTVRVLTYCTVEKELYSNSEKQIVYGILHSPCAVEHFSIQFTWHPDTANLGSCAPSYDPNSGNHAYRRSNMMAIFRRPVLPVALFADRNLPCEKHLKRRVHDSS